MNRIVVLVSALLFLGLGNSTALGMGEQRPAGEAKVKTEQLALKCTKGGCPGGEGFCCTTDQRRLQQALLGVNGVRQVIPDKARRTFTVEYPKDQVKLAELQRSAREAGFEIVEARKIKKD